MCSRVEWRFREERKALPSMRVVHLHCANQEAYPYHAVLLDFIVLYDLFRSYLCSHIYEGSMAEQPVWDVIDRIFIHQSRDIYFRFSQEEDHNYFGVAEGL